MKGLLFRRRKSPRASWYDYTLPGGYFITICTKNRIHYFGEIINGKMILNKLGQYCIDHRKSIPTHYPFVTCDEFICMPDHIHGILFIRENQPNENHVGTQFFASDASDIASPKRNICPSGSLGSIMRGFKIGITKYANSNHIPFSRQGRYHDTIIHDHSAYQNISNYIRNNPKNRKKR